MDEYNNCDCKDGKCPSGINEIRKISLTPKEKRTIFHSILNLISNNGSKPEKRRVTASELVEM